MTHERMAGEVAIEVARQLTDPLRGLRDRLGLVVDHLERHVATSTGPTPYPWRSLQSLRHDLAAAYLESTQLARRIEELDRAVRDAVQPASAPAWFDLSAAVDLGLRLASHHLGPNIELLIDLGTAPSARGTPGTLALLVAQLVAACAESARQVTGSSLSVRVWSEQDWAVVTIADNGGGNPRAFELGELGRELLAPWDATLDTAFDEGRGVAFELRLIGQA